MVEDQDSAQDNVNGPNIIIILADDLAMSDLGLYGGEIDTPNLNSLASTALFLPDFTQVPCVPLLAQCY